MRKRKATRSEIIERNGKIVKDYENGLSFEQLSEKYGLCVRTCYRALDEEQQAQRIAEEQDHANLVDKIVAEYQKNTAVRDIAEKYGVSIGYCSAIAVQAGISNKELSHRRFTFGHTVRPLCRDDARTLARMFFASVGYSASDAEIESLLNDTSQYYTASKITNLCIDHIIDWVANQEDTPCIGKV